MEKLKLSNEVEQGKDQISLLELINKDRTNIDSVKFLTHYELGREYDNPLVHLTYDVQKFMLQLRLDNPLIETTIDENGGFSNFLFRLKNSKILNSVNILKYAPAQIPTELREIPDGNKIYIIRFYAAAKNRVNEIDVDAIIEDGGIVINENDVYYHIVFDDSLSIEKYWTEDIFKAIFATKKKGFYLGLNDPDKKANLEQLKEYAGDEEVFLFARNPLTIDNLPKVTVAQIKMRTLPTNLNVLLKKKYKPFKNNVKRPESILSKFSATDKVELIPDKIESKIEERLYGWK